ncbi:hypothetical protein TTHERM_00556730 (macronuclear) [Tetrahymena thermophila SB210]|uniref:Uncharacterized protein n=1 Tax=Tetrahymena thermophila (strain SB210) TaxID=312017 RepID=I7M339_TETTS|nr:hypothetical protein TTHERM_00556730 [Tetrahymena thermophila SB210]EAS02091.2 hypothetical protein TTHERM_00556730 [Tetrahymena thermophila SB210]|eukprot:XP_001022336.2 hypothetical protein TTHERM_00556730 [Tetrahymena thermophila SB210]
MTGSQALMQKRYVRQVRIIIFDEFSPQEQLYLFKVLWSQDMLLEIREPLRIREWDQIGQSCNSTLLPLLSQMMKQERKYIRKQIRKLLRMQHLIKIDKIVHFKYKFVQINQSSAEICQRQFQLSSPLLNNNYMYVFRRMSTLTRIIMQDLTAPSVPQSPQILAQVEH